MKVVRIGSQIEQIDSPIGREIALGRAIIHQALDDLVSDNPKLWMEKRLAKSWLLAGGKDFELICDLAQVEPNDVRARVRVLVEHPEQHRVRL